MSVPLQMMVPLWGVCPFVGPSVFPIVLSSVHPFVRLFVRLFVHSSNRPFIHSAVLPFVSSFFGPFIRSFVGTLVTLLSYDIGSSRSELCQRHISSTVVIIHHDTDISVFVYFFCAIPPFSIIAYVVVLSDHENSEPISYRRMDVARIILFRLKVALFPLFPLSRPCPMKRFYDPSFSLKRLIATCQQHST